MCEYCNPPYKEIVQDTAEIIRVEPYPNEMATDDMPRWAIRVTFGGGSHYWPSAGDEYVPVKYCPMCGRKLEPPATD